MSSPVTPEEFRKLQRKLDRERLENLVAEAFAARGITGFAREYQFATSFKKKWRADFAFLFSALLVEIEGGTWSGGRHVLPRGFQADCEKYNAAALLGYRVLRYTGDDVLKRMEMILNDVKAIVK